MANAKTTSPAPVSEASQETNETSAPAIRKQFGHVVVSTWPKTVTNSDGTQRHTWVTSVTRVYRDGNEYKRSAYLFPKDLLDCAHALQKTFDDVNESHRSQEQADAQN